MLLSLDGARPSFYQSGHRPRRRFHWVFSTPSTSSPSTSAGGVTLEAVMVQLQHMDVCLDTLNTKLYQVNTRVSRIEWWQARLGGFVESLSPSPKSSEDKDDNGDSDGATDKDKDASSSSDDKMIASQWLTICHSWEKGGVVLGMRVVMYIGGELVIGDIFVRGSVFFLKDVVRTLCIFSFLYFWDTLFLRCDSKPSILFDIYIYILRLLLHSFTYLFMCCFFSLFMHMLLIYCMQSFISVSH